jgi:hypothetical protein
VRTFQNGKIIRAALSTSEHLLHKAKWAKRGTSSSASRDQPTASTYILETFI